MHYIGAFGTVGFTCSVGSIIPMMILPQASSNSLQMLEYEKMV